MFALRGSFLALALAFFLSCARADEGKPTPAEEEIRVVLDAQVAAWNKGDLDGYMAGYWKSDELKFYSGGTITKGWKETAERYRKRYKGEGTEMGKLSFSEVEVEILSPTAAIVRGRWKLDLSNDKPEGLFTLVVKKIDKEGWRVTSDHTSVAEPPKQ